MHPAMQSAGAREPNGLLHLTLPGLFSDSGTEIPVRFVESNGRLQILFPSNPVPRWAQTLFQAPTVLWRIGTARFAGRALPVEGRDAARVRTRFETEFGADRVRRWFGSSFQAFDLEPLNLDAAGYADSVEAYFDRLAASYDLVVAGNRLDAGLRSVSEGLLLRLFRPGDRVLEIGSGTGLETLPLARRGVEVVATDISAEMIRRLQVKVETEGLGQFVETRQMRATDVVRLLREFGAASFDGAFSNFGALNCEASLGEIPRVLATLLHRDSPAVFGIWNRLCMAESILSLARLKPRRALARLQTPVPVGLSRYGIPVFAHTVRSFVTPFLPYFFVERVAGVPVFVPPYDYERLVARSDGFFAMLRRLDDQLGRTFPFNRFGDHFFVELRRRA